MSKVTMVEHRHQPKRQSQKLHTTDTASTKACVKNRLTSPSCVFCRHRTKLNVANVTQSFRQVKGDRDLPRLGQAQTLTR